MRLSCRSIAIIGGGPAGITAAKYLEAERIFSKVTVFEQRSTVGGVWNYTSQEKTSKPVPVPSTDARVGAEKPVWRQKCHNPTEGHQKSSENEEVSVPESHKDAHGTSNADPVFVSPMYSSLTTNLPKQLMRFSDHAFPTTAQIFPPHEIVKDYLASYAESVTDRIRFRTQVIDVWKDNPGDAQSPWLVVSMPLDTGKIVREEYDAVIVASGHFATPFIPNLPGIEEWQEVHPGTIYHSKYYDQPQEFKKNRVLVIGASASGLDIVGQIASVNERSVLLASNHPLDKVPIRFKDNTTTHAGLVSVDPVGRTVRFSDGEEAKDIDVLLFATGYLYTLSFLSRLDPAAITPAGRRVQRTFEHLFYWPDPTLSFLALPQRVVPFPLSEAQASVVARVYAGRLDTPSQEAMKKWEDDRIEQRGEGESFHLMPFPEDLEYINQMVDWAAHADKREGLENDGLGKQAERWEDRQRWMRANVLGLRKAFEAKGEEKGSYTNLSELGLEDEGNGSIVGG
ncbi:putative flavin dependent monooxygenase [Eremomyces bilateralis CBS 781.70]|uniref:Flavin dependent monooxygenase n=1 Tax=Eremomyces bilateralis CBS 781.70 TaxID=1392243 RepID=A0A6G1G704_9PEZI|nr:putative flavin dependent monooxygenase [Eremomyces bilateralis CBS 781.70]KAF1813609.1 putative flavin dependent monooxygenase [Eremomyces bilateralis CBS 781.70]